MKDSSVKKTIYIVIWVIALILFILLIMRFNMYGMAGKFYNQGNKYFREGDYSSAEAKYSRALIEKATKRMDCKLRINYALSITTPITPESVTPENLEQMISRLEDAINILVVNGCAHLNDSKGHNKRAQILKEEIEDYIEWLKNNVKELEKQENDDNSGNDNDKKQQNENDEEAQAAAKKQQDLKQQFENIQQEGMNERMQELNEFQNFGKYEYYDGKNW